MQSVRKWLLLIGLCLTLNSCAGMQPPDVPGCTPLNSKLVKWSPPMLPATRADGLVYRPNPVCMSEIGEGDCGYCTFTISEKSIFVGEKPEHHFNKKPWSQLRKKCVLFPAQESYAPLKAFAINACKQMGSLGACKDIAKWRIKLDSLDSVGTLIKK